MKHLLFKDEDEDDNGAPIGPLFIMSEDGAHESFELENGVAKWFTLKEAQAIARNSKLELKTF